MTKKTRKIPNKKKEHSVTCKYNDICYQSNYSRHKSENIRYLVLSDKINTPVNRHSPSKPSTKIRIVKMYGGEVNIAFN